MRYALQKIRSKLLSTTAPCLLPFCHLVSYIIANWTKEGNRYWYLPIAVGSSNGLTNTRCCRYNVNKTVQLDATVCRHLFTAQSLYMFRVSQHPSSGVLKTTIDTVVCAPDDGRRYHPKHVEQFPDKINCVTLHLVGHILQQSTSFSVLLAERFTPALGLHSALHSSLATCDRPEGKTDGDVKLPTCSPTI